MSRKIRMSAGPSVTTSPNAVSWKRQSGTSGHTEYNSCLHCGEPPAGGEDYYTSDGAVVCRSCATREARVDQPSPTIPGLGYVFWRLLFYAACLIAFFAATYYVAYGIGWVLFTTGVWTP